MKTLSHAILPSLPTSIVKPQYRPEDVIPGIVHFGIGNFHRSHQALYCEALLNQGRLDCGIIGVSLRSGAMRDSLIQQDYLYTQVTLGHPNTYQVVGAIQDILVAPEDPYAVIERISAKTTALITTTITEKGYCLQNGAIDPAHTDMQNDVASLDTPLSIYGFITAGLIMRYHTSQSPITILCCDNVQNGGGLLADGVAYLLKIHAPELLTWFRSQVACISSMVDRITPSTTQELLDEVAQACPYHDNAPVPAEPFTQWIIEDKSPFLTIPFADAGAVLTHDIHQFEAIKLRFLNAAHSILATIGYLVGDQYIHEVMQREPLVTLTHKILAEDFLPITSPPDGVDVQQYITDVLARFSNDKVPYPVLQVGSDSSLKIQQRWFPNIDLVLAAQNTDDKLAFMLACWVQFIQHTVKDQTLNDPARTSFANITHTSSLDYVTAVLSIANADRFQFFADESFMQKVLAHFAAMQTQSVTTVLTQLLSK